MNSESLHSFHCVEVNGSIPLFLFFGAFVCDCGSCVLIVVHKYIFPPNASSLASFHKSEVNTTTLDHADRQLFDDRTLFSIFLTTVIAHRNSWVSVYVCVSTTDPWRPNTLDGDPPVDQPSLCLDRITSTSSSMTPFSGAGIVYGSRGMCTKASLLLVSVTSPYLLVPSDAEVF